MYVNYVGSYFITQSSNFKGADLYNVRQVKYSYIDKEYIVKLANISLC